MAKDDVRGRVAVITAGSRGIGYAVAEALHEHGASVVLLVRTEAAVKAAAERLGGGAPALPVAVDVRDAEAVADALGQAAGWHRLDIIVNCAGPQSRCSARRVTAARPPCAIPPSCRGPWFMTST
jgi:NAD(P)-dependent dehydrogenase (short-subunit alcohol dehydrogenase family)